MTEAAKKGFLTRIESVRGLAALCVAVGHTQGFLLVENGKGLLDQTTVRDFVLRLLNGLSAMAKLR